MVADGVSELRSVRATVKWAESGAVSTLLVRAFRHFDGRGGCYFAGRFDIVFMRHLLLRVSQAPRPRQLQTGRLLSSGGPCSSEWGPLLLCGRV